MSAQWYLWDLGGLLNITEEEPSCLAAIVAAMEVRQGSLSEAPHLGCIAFRLPSLGVS